MTRCTKCLWSIVGVALALGAAKQSGAVPIPGLFSTGVNGGGAVLPGGSIDAHYTVLGGALGPTTFVVVNPAGLGWIGNTATSAWISGDPGANASAATYTYTIAFNLIGFDSSTAVITGQWSADDEGEMFLNGNPVSASGGSGLFTPFSINDGFAPGANLLTFEVPNADNNNGLHVQIISSDVQQASAAPEPASIILFGVGVLLGMTRRRL